MGKLILERVNDSGVRGLDMGIVRYCGEKRGADRAGYHGDLYVCTFGGGNSLRFTGYVSKGSPLIGYEIAISSALVMLSAAGTARVDVTIVVKKDVDHGDTLAPRRGVRAVDVSKFFGGTNGGGIMDTGTGCGCGDCLTRAIHDWIDSIHRDADFISKVAKLILQIDPSGLDSPAESIAKAFANAYYGSKADVKRTTKGRRNDSPKVALKYARLVRDAIFSEAKSVEILSASDGARAYAMSPVVDPSWSDCVWLWSVDRNGVSLVREGTYRISDPSKSSNPPDSSDRITHIYEGDSPMMRKSNFPYAKIISLAIAYESSPRQIVNVDLIEEPNAPFNSTKQPELGASVLSLLDVVRKSPVIDRRLGSRHVYVRSLVSTRYLSGWELDLRLACSIRDFMSSTSKLGVSISEHVRVIFSSLGTLLTQSQCRVSDRWSTVNAFDFDSVEFGARSRAMLSNEVTPNRLYFAWLQSGSLEDVGLRVKITGLDSDGGAYRRIMGHAEMTPDKLLVSVMWRDTCLCEFTYVARIESSLMFRGAEGTGITGTPEQISAFTEIVTSAGRSRFCEVYPNITSLTDSPLLKLNSEDYRLVGIDSSDVDYSPVVKLGVIIHRVRAEDDGYTWHLGTWYGRKDSETIHFLKSVGNCGWIRFEFARCNEALHTSGSIDTAAFIADDACRLSKEVRRLSKEVREVRKEVRKLLPKETKGVVASKAWIAPLTPVSAPGASELYEELKAAGLSRDTATFTKKGTEAEVEVVGCTLSDDGCDVQTEEQVKTLLSLLNDKYQIHHKNQIRVLEWLFKKSEANNGAPIPASDFNISELVLINASWLPIDYAEPDWIVCGGSKKWWSVSHSGRVFGELIIHAGSPKKGGRYKLRQVGYGEISGLSGTVYRYTCKDKLMSFHRSPEPKISGNRRVVSADLYSDLGKKYIEVVVLVSTDDIRGERVQLIYEEV